MYGEERKCRVFFITWRKKNGSEMNDSHGGENERYQTRENEKGKSTKKRNRKVDGQ